MLSIQHLLCGAIALGSSIFKRQVGYLVFPDAIRMYSCNRQYSHFEKSYDGSDVSWWSFPKDLSKINREYVQSSLKSQSHLVSEIKPCALSEETCLYAFYEHNNHLPGDMFLGIEMHLRQDRVLDSFIRENIDCSDMYYDCFRRNGKIYNGKEIRQMIERIEQYGIFYSSYELYKRDGVIANQQWLEDTVKPILFNLYPYELAEKTYSYMKIDKTYNLYISNKDWSKLDIVPDGFSRYDFKLMCYKAISETFKPYEDMLKLA